MAANGVMKPIVLQQGQCLFVDKMKISIRIQIVYFLKCSAFLELLSDQRTNDFLINLNILNDNLLPARKRKLCVTTFNHYPSIEMDCDTVDLPLATEKDSHE